MKIKDYECKCGHDDFFFANKGSQKGIYCSYCGKWFKWADKDEQNLAMKQEPILDKIRAEIEQEYKVESEHPYGQGLRRALQIIDKHKAESEDKE